jgi:hypothetical protein
MESLPIKQSRLPRLARIGVLGLALAVAAGGFWWLNADPASPLEGYSSWAPNPVEVDGLEAVATIEGETFTVHTVGGERSFLPGVNLGATIPGRYPGELALTAEDYRRWFPEMADMGFRAVRIYTVHPPAFYEELARFNTEHPDTPLYLLHGIWPPEELMFETVDVWDHEVVAAFESEIDEAVAAAHGELDAYHLHPEFGAYSADVSRWLVAWAIGAEWEPTIIGPSDEVNSGLAPYRGSWVSATAEATPTESWLASMFDHLAEAQSAHGTAAPMTFVNWPTTDPLTHPAEPNPATEDSVSIDANHIDASGWPGGRFASYHAYPYFPDFMRYEYVDADDPYGAYLDELRVHHGGMPVMITEFGVSGGWGYAHSEPTGRNHGMHGEREQMQIDADLMHVIHDRGMAGGMVFEWTDEWFKFTWNTLEYMRPDERRALWHDLYTNESFFGMVSTEPGAGGTQIVVDGDAGEWVDTWVLAGGGGVEESVGDLFGGALAGLFDNDGAIKIEAAGDAAFLYLHIRLPEAWEGDPIEVRLDAAERDGTFPMSRVVIDPNGSRLQWWSEFDPFVAHHGSKSTEYVPTQEDLEGWNPVRLLTGRVQVAPSGEVHPAELLDVSEFVRGTSDPEDPDFDALAGWEADGKTIELRIPWLAVGFSDPSDRNVISVAEDGSVSGLRVTGLQVSVDTVQGSASGEYHWQPWNTVDFHERIKDGAQILVEANLELGGE